MKTLKIEGNEKMAVTHFASFDLSRISKNTVFVLDTNVLYYVHSGYYLPTFPKSIGYSNIIQQILNGGYKISISSFSVQELLFGIETKEYYIYCNYHHLSSRTYTKKDYRNNNTQRTSVQGKLQTVLSELGIYYIDDGAVYSNYLNDFVNEFSMHKMDPMDYILTKNYDSQNTIFVSEDRDFASMPLINVLTL